MARAKGTEEMIGITQPPGMFPDREARVRARPCHDAREGGRNAPVEPAGNSGICGIDTGNGITPSGSAGE